MTLQTEFCCGMYYDIEYQAGDACSLLVLNILQVGEKIIYHHVAGGMRESHPRVQDLQHPRLVEPCLGLQISDVIPSSLSQGGDILVFEQLTASLSY